MVRATQDAFTCELEESRDEHNWLTNTIKCHGRLVGATADELRATVKPLIERGGSRIVIDCADVSYLDSSGLGTLVGLKVSAVNKGYCTLELTHLSERLKELLRITKLTQLLVHSDAVR